MSDDAFDVVVIGAGVFGLATSLELAKRGHRVAVIDRWGIGHPVTSSTGASRSIRVSYDHPVYVGLALQAIEAWRALEAETGRTILHLTGQIDLGPADKLAALASTVAAAGLPMRDIGANETRALFPELRLKPGERALFHEQAGTVLAEAGLAALLQAAVSRGVVVRAPERVTRIRGEAPLVIDTDRGSLSAGRIVIAAGPWTGELLAMLGLGLPLSPAIAQVTFLSAPELVDRPGLVEWQAFGATGIYAHPVPGIGYKIALDAGSEGWDPDTEEWGPVLAEERQVLDWLSSRLTLAAVTVQRTQRHPWTMTPDADFVIGASLKGAVTLACGCSGHAFKFGPALGPLVADALEGRAIPELFSPARPGLRAAAPSPAAPITR
ncbi:sarcosine oxidase [Rhodoligotrophos appendicifer]|uniref:FAD-dependent oxidoreductase n=1 Tax=Rhodoligotrophos appendicifer TaxID=987056 RepID=UPI0011859283|nr:FAD-dependent oxidoreductase [Rhodoligotrophos appendicifer]